MRAWTATVSVLLAAFSAGCEWMPAPTPTAPGSPTSTDVAPRTTTAAVNVNLTGTWQGQPVGHSETLTLALEHSQETVKGVGTVANEDGEAEIAAFGTYFAIGRVSLSLHSEDNEHYADATFTAPVEADTLNGILKMEGHEHSLTLHRVAP